MVRWSDLPLELVEFIESKITIYHDKVRIRMVCKSWRSRLPVLHQNACWLLHKPYGKTEEMHGLFNPIDKTFYGIDLKYAKEKYIVGCSYGWVAILNDNITEIRNPARQKVYLINLLTNARVSLPSTEIKPRDRRQLEIRKIVLSSPFADKNCIAVAIYKYTEEITYCRCGDRTWNRLFTGFCEEFQDVTFHEDKLLSLRRDGKISVFKLTGQRAKFVSDIYKWDSSSRAAFFVKSSTGGIILVCIIEGKNKRPGFELYEIDVINGKMHQIYDIGDNNLFMDSTSAIMVPSTTGDQSNQIYSIKNITSPDSDIEKSILSVFNLEKGTLRVLSHSKTTSEVLCRPNIWVKMN